MALFDACKAFEEDKASFAATADLSTDDSNEHIIGTGTQQQETASSPKIRPLDPSLADVRYLPPKNYDAP